MNKPLYTPEEFREIMLNMGYLYVDDVEFRHIRMDDLMCELLESLGYGEGVKIFKGSRRHYA